MDRPCEKRYIDSIKVKKKQREREKYEDKRCRRENLRDRCELKLDRDDEIGITQKGRHYYHWLVVGMDKDPDPVL